MRGSRRRLIGACAAAVFLAGGASATASAGSWWPSALLFPRPGRIGLAANSAGSFLLVDGRGTNEAALCTATTPVFTLGGPEPSQLGTMLGTGGSVVPGSPSFEPDGRSLAIFLTPVLDSQYVEVFEGPSGAPADISPTQPPGSSTLIGTTVFVPDPGVTSATGTRGDVAVVGVPNEGPSMTLARRPAGATEWLRETISGYSYPQALAVDGLGDTTLLARSYATSGPSEIASAYFAAKGAPFTPLALPGSYFTAIASDNAGRSAIAGYTPTGPDGPGLYLSRRESPDAQFGAPVLLSSRSLDPRPQLAYDAAGVLSVAWNEGADVAVATAAPGQPVGAAQALSAPGAPVASDEQLAVDAAGEAVLSWAGGPHEELAGFGLHGVPAPVFATVRASASAPFQAVQELATSASYGEGLYPHRASPEARVVDAISSGRAMVAWLEQGASGPEVRAALYAAGPGCAGPPLVGAAASARAPLISDARLTNRRFRVGRRATAISARRPPLGTTFHFALSAAARLQIAITRSLAGLRHGHSCLAPSAGLRRMHAGRCTRTLTVAVLTRGGEREGADSVAFSGRIGHRALPAGAYRAVLSARNPAGRSTPVTLGFTVVP